MKNEIKQSLFHAKSGEYETPDEIFNPLNEEFHFTLDVAANFQNAKCSCFFTKLDNGLIQDWGQNTCWMNPPFGRQMKLWVKKAYESSLMGATVVCLLPVRSNTNWWHDYVIKGNIRFIRGRVIFKGQEKGLWFPLSIIIFDLCKGNDNEL